MEHTSIVVGTDGSEAANETVRRGAELARSCGATLHIVAAYRDLRPAERQRALREFPVGLDVDGAGDPRTAATAILEDVADAVGARTLCVSLHAVKSNPADALCDVARRERAGLILVGNRGAGNPLRRVVRPIYDKVARHAPCEVRIIDTEHYRRPEATRA
jgi:nucleotide-binding universal stress UspA family protein